MQYNKLIPSTILAAVATTFGGFLQAAPLISIGDTVDIFFRGSISGQYRSNVFNNPVKESDYVLIISPGVEVNMGRGEIANLNVVFREDILRYNRFTGQNKNLSNVFVDGSYGSGPLTTNAGFSFQQRQTNTTQVVPVPVRQQVLQDRYNAYINAEYDFSPKTYFDGGFDWTRTDYTNNADFNNRYNNRDIYSVPLNVLYRYSEKLSVGLGYRYRYTDIANNTNPQDHFVSLALRGELLPKLNARINAGFQQRDRAGQSNDNTFSMLSRFDYLYSPKVSLFAVFDRDFNTSGVGTSIENTGGRVGGTYQITPLISSTASVGYDIGDYVNNPRKDKTTRADLAFTYAPNAFLAFTAGYSYQNNNSNLAGASFMGHIVNLSASLRY